MFELLVTCTIFYNHLARNFEGYILRFSLNKITFEVALGCQQLSNIMLIAIFPHVNRVKFFSFLVHLSILFRCTYTSHICKPLAYNQ